jgi:TRAP-type C4-dicarboxylate transport system permease small subunit
MGRVARPAPRKPREPLRERKGSVTFRPPGRSPPETTNVERIANLYCKGLNVLSGLALVGMVGLVFGNVVMRYAFNSSISISEEVSRWLFVWITFLGAVVALRERTHLGTDVVVSRLPPMGKKICFVVAHLLMLYVCWLVFSGSLEQAQINSTSMAPATQLPLSIIYYAGVVFAVSAGVMLLLDLWLMLSHRLRDDQLVMTQEAEGMADVHATNPDGATHKQA